MSAQWCSPLDYHAPCHQVSALFMGGILGWVGKTSVLVHTNALHHYVLDANLPNAATRAACLETFGFIRKRQMHIDHVQWLMGAEGELRDAGLSCLSQRMRFWVNYWPAAPVRGPDVGLLQGVIEAGWTVRGNPREGLDVMTPKEHLAAVEAQVADSLFFRDVRTEPPAS